MPRFDLDLPALREYRPEVRRPADFDAFWERTVAEARAAASEPVFTPVDGPLRGCDVFDVRFSGFGGHPIGAWLLLPAGATEPLPAIVTFAGYGGGRGVPHEHLPWVVAGFAVLVMDTRGQGSQHGAGGVTPDPVGSGPASNGFVTRGIDDPETYYYRRVFTDAVRAVDTALGHPLVDPARVTVAGVSQGGGITLAATALHGGVAAALIDVPFLCHFERAVGMTGREPYEEVSRYLAVHRFDVDRVFDTLAYFDGVNFAARATATSLFSVALHDPICPPSTVFAAHNAYAGDTDIVVYPFNQHEGGASAHWPQQVAFLERVL